MLPKAVRESLKLYPGCKVDVSVDAQRRLVLTPSLHDPEELFVDRPPVKRVLSIEEMDHAVARAARGRV